MDMEDTRLLIITRRLTCHPTALTIGIKAIIIPSPLMDTIRRRWRGPGPLGYDTHGRHPYPFRYLYMPPPPQHGVAPWAPGQEPANQPSSTYVSTGQLVERPRSANGGRGSTIGASSPVGPIDEPEMDIPQPHDEPSQPEQGNETPPAIRDVSPEATAKDAPPITPSPGPYEPAVRSTYDAFWSNLKRVNVSEMASQRIPRASMQDNVGHTFRLSANSITLNC